MSLPSDFEWPGTGRASDLFEYILKSPEWATLRLAQMYREPCVASIYALKGLRITVSNTVAPKMRPARDTLAYLVRRGIRVCFERQFEVVRDAVVTSLDEVRAFMQFVVSNISPWVLGPPMPFERRRDAVLDMMLEYIDSSSQWEQSQLKVVEDETGCLVFSGGVHRTLTLRPPNIPSGYDGGVLTAEIWWDATIDVITLCCTVDVRNCMDFVTKLALGE